MSLNANEMNCNVCTDGQETDMPKEVQNIQNKTRWFQQKIWKRRKFST
jgi:hypothetical protein